MVRNKSDSYQADTLKTQFVKDLNNMTELGSHVWIFSKKGKNQDIKVLKESVLKALKKSDGTPIDELGDLFNDTTFPDKISKVFKTEINNSTDLINALDNPDMFNQIFKIVE